MKASGEPERLIQPRWAAHATTAGRRPRPQAGNYANAKRQQQHESRTHEVSSVTMVDSIAQADRELVEWMTALRERFKSGARTSRPTAPRCDGPAAEQRAFGLVLAAGESRKTDMCKVLHIRLYSEPQAEPTY